MAVISDKSEVPSFLASAPGFSFFDPGEIHEEVRADSEYETWRRWRYEHVSLEFQASVYRIAKVMHEANREKWPWWATTGSAMRCIM